MVATTNDWSDEALSTSTPRPLRIAPKLLLPAVLCLATAAHAETININALPRPSNAYPGDHIGVPLLGGGFCNAALPDPAHPPTIRMTEHHVMGFGQDSYRYDVGYTLRNTPDILCGVPPGPPIHYTDVGELPLGYHYFDVSGTIEGEEYVSYSTSWVLVRVHDRPADDISGIWYAPEQSGRGFSVTRSGSTFVLYWATHDGAGEPTWATLITSENEDRDNNQNTFGGVAIATSGAPLSAGSATLVAEPWAEVRFTYEGCGRAAFEWSPLAVAGGEAAVSAPEVGGSLALRQVLVPDGAEQCDATVLSGGLVAEWIEVP